ncbi:Piso0_002462 [Millerozyma farinosa CBS 7064]|uniref:Piso0_002462 protein n=1 Tax=Pichia sorbitophila (strain ATCC MYA-4447 / BCRC 22081 / CBS 7064 / NBRC 10061 / NRRL Y-12695) TaxID=559304 RepID=G8YF41_PICSO|nr:Piso0_002462 [Millerozyma farinosa CBS 7064]
MVGKNIDIDQKQQDSMVEAKQGNGMVNSPSESSISSINSNSSTGKLIRDLSEERKQLEEHKEDDMSKSESTHTLTLPKKKAIKFTVRKVSHESIKVHKTSEPKFEKEAVETAETKKQKEQLKAAQLKYDQYSSRIAKIEKEIGFLTRLLPPFNVEVDYVTRNKIGRAIEKLRMKQDELDKKKYGLGITISRLWRDNSDTEIWVRSVSN